MSKVIKCSIKSFATIRTKNKKYGRLYEFSFSSEKEEKEFIKASHEGKGRFYTSERLPEGTKVEFHLDDSGISSFRPKRDDEVEALNSDHYIRETARILALKKAGAFAASEDDVI